MPIKERDFSAARDILSKAGSTTASDIHTISTGDSRPDQHGRDLIDTCMAEFQRVDREMCEAGTLSKSDLWGGLRMTKHHYDAIAAAKKKLGLR
ncbi:hypothetical protein KHP62_18225 [Rhodobacteraceae bacterium NNCM2]|nr:hypothetical protein [Coraliihabitans acroporae]